MRFWMMAHRAVIALAALLSLSLSVPLAWGQCDYELVEMERPDTCVGGKLSYLGIGINDQGHQAGGLSCNSGGTHPVRWTDSGAQILPRLPGFSTSLAGSINKHGMMSGTSSILGSLMTATKWEGDTVIDLGTGPLGNWSGAGPVNDSGQIVGSWIDSVSGHQAAALWQGSKLITIHDDIDAPNSRARGINDLGVVVGWMGDAITSNHRAFMWDDGVVTDLGVIPGGHTAKAIAINNKGQIVGSGFLPRENSTGNISHAFVWEDGEMTNIGLRPDLGPSSLVDINDLGQAVGTSTMGPYLWDDGEILFLREKIPLAWQNTLRVARAINNHGVITFGDRVFLRPLSTAPGDIDHNCRVDREDLFLLLEQWGEPDSFADTNEDGVVNVIDLLQLLGDWG